MAESPKKTCVIRTAEHFDAICSPVRASILETLLAFGPMPAREIAAKIARPVSLTHHHVGLLVDVGIVVEKEKVKRGRHLERVFVLPFDDFRFDFDTNPKVAAKGMLRLVKTFGRFTERMFGRSLQGGLTDLMKEFATFRCETAHLSKDSILQVRGHLQAIRKIFEQERGAPGGDPFQVFWSFYPLGVAAESFSAGKAKKSRKRHQGAG